MLSSYPERLRFLGIDLHSRTRRRLAVMLTYGVYVAVMMAPMEHESSEGKIVMWVASLCVVLFGVFGDKGPVKSFNLVRAPKSAMRRALDTSAKRRYGVEFDELSGEKRIEVMLEVSDSATPEDLGPMIVDPDMPDEREMVQRSRALTRTLQVMVTWVLARAVNLSSGRVHDRENLAGALLIMVIIVTLPKAIILWTADDPWQSEELELVGREG